ncbi:MAG: MFS transporter [Gammaproteobacteria bacterium]
MRNASELDASQRRRHAFWWVALAFVVNMIGTTLPTPLYPIYQHQLGFSELMVTVIYAVYAAGVIAVLIVCGRWSDQIGRRRMLFAGLALSAASAVAFLLEGGLPALFIGRVLSGMSAGIFTGTATVAIVELAPAGQRTRATLVATAANMGGLGCGPLLAGLLAQYLPLPLQLCFFADLALVAVAAFGVWFAPETVKIARHPQLGLQRLGLPPEVRGVFVPAAIAGFAGFAVLGFFTAVAPAVLGRLLKLPNHALIGAVVFLLFMASTAGQAALQWVPRKFALALGCLVQIAGVGFIAAAIALASLPLLLAGAVVAGAGQGLAFRAGMADVTAASPEARSGEIVSTFFVVVYVAISIPVIGVGIAVEKVGLRDAGIGFAIGVGVLSLAALLLLLARRARSA